MTPTEKYASEIRAQAQVLVDMSTAILMFGDDQLLQRATTIQQAHAKIAEPVRLLANRANRQASMSEGIEAVEVITRTVCGILGQDYANVVGRCRKYEYVYPRHIAMYVAHKHYHLPLKRIGQAFGRDRTTVIHALKEIESQASVMKPMQRQIQQVLDALEFSRNLENG